MSAQPTTSQTAVCPRCGHAPLIVRGGPLTQENIDRIRVFCRDCAWPFDRQDVERIVTI